MALLVARDRAPVLMLLAFGAAMLWFRAVASEKCLPGSWTLSLFQAAQGATVGTTRNTWPESATLTQEEENLFTLRIGQVEVEISHVE